MAVCPCARTAKQVRVTEKQRERSVTIARGRQSPTRLFAHHVGRRQKNDDEKLAPFLDQALLMRFAIGLDAFLAMQLQLSTHVYGSLAQQLVLAALSGSTERRTRQKSGGP